MRVRRSIMAVAGAAAALTVVGAVPANAASGTEYLTFVQTNPNSNKSAVSATGPIHALGTDVQLTNNRDRITFPHGTVLFSHQQKSGSQHFDKQTCTGRFTERGVYRIISGTGAYSHVKGNGTYSLSGIFIGCNQNKPPTEFSLIINAAGPLSY